MNPAITEIELRRMLKQCKKTAPREDNINYQMFENIHLSLFKYPLMIYNTIWSNSIFSITVA